MLLSKNYYLGYTFNQKFFTNISTDKIYASIKYFVYEKSQPLQFAISYFVDFPFFLFGMQKQFRRKFRRKRNRKDGISRRMDVQPTRISQQLHQQRSVQRSGAAIKTNSRWPLARTRWRMDICWTFKHRRSGYGRCNFTN